MSQTRPSDDTAKTRILVVRAGDRSLHDQWIANEPDRQWDLHISYYGNKVDPYSLHDGVRLSREKGPKWIGINDCLDSNPYIWDYDQIGFPDDDLMISTGSWDDVFLRAEESDASIAQPSLDHRSFFWHDVTLNRPAYHYRTTDFIELMAPIFTREFLQAVKPLFCENRSSLGIDYLWSSIARREERRQVIVDSSALLHTRAIGGGEQYKGTDPKNEYAALMNKYDISPWHGSSLSAFVDNRKLNVHPALLNRKQLSPRLYRKVKDIMLLRTIG